ncbi:MAG: AAA family ATPase [Planctomycetia bacterium]|nr:AAA family ATPase [Planctomycetia bacterium]
MARPIPKFHDFVGQRMIVARLARQVQGAHQRGEPVPHSLFIGASGLGKTQLAEALAKAAGTTVHRINGRSAEANVVERIQQCRFADIVFFDEAHQLGGAVQELLYDVIDHSRLPRRLAPVVESPEENAAEFKPIEPITLVLATDRPGKLHNALRKRIPIIEHFLAYSDEEMREIVDTLAAQQGILLSPQARNLIADVSRGVPRRAVHHLGRLRLHLPNSASENLSLSSIRKYLHDFEFDDAGLGSVEIAYMRKLRSFEMASLETLAQSLGLDGEFVRREIESGLFNLELIAIGAHGRYLTEAGHLHLKSIPKCVSAEENAQ